MSNITSLQTLQEQLRYTFGDPRLLLLSLTHVSYGHENHQDRNPSHRDNERFEFLGDSVLSLVISDLLLESFPEASEGQLSKMRAAVVNEKTLSEISRSLHLNSLLRLGKGETRSGGADKASILSSAFEALIAAIYIDGGFNAVYPVVRYLFSPLFRNDQGLISFQDHKTRLQETAQSRFKLTPTYHLSGSTGPDHAKVFRVEVRLGERILAVGEGSSKKEAEQKAAEAALCDLPESREGEAR
jgi:ribonuclease-3